MDDRTIKKLTYMLIELPKADLHLISADFKGAFSDNVLELKAQEDAANNPVPEIVKPVPRRP